MSEQSSYTLPTYTASDGRRYHSCVPCPMWDGEWAACQAPGAPRNSDTSRNSDNGYADGDVPDWCPLRKGPITIRLEET